MARRNTSLPPGTTLPQQSGTRRFYGVVHFTSNRGNQYARMWPGKRPGPGTENQQLARQFFKNLAQVQMQAIPTDRVIAGVIARGSRYAWRDILSMMTTGQLMEIVGQPDMGISDYLDLVSDVPGSILVRGPDDWLALAPAAGGQVVTWDAALGLPQWATPSAGGGGAGLYGASMSAKPTFATTGLNAWLNQGDASWFDSNAGLVLSAPSKSSVNLRALTKPALTPPYTVTALLAIDGNITSFISTGIGWYDGSAKLHMLHYVWTGSAWSVNIERWSSPTAGSVGNDFSGSGVVQPLWMRLHDDGVNISFHRSRDGANFYPLFSVAKSAGYLGATGYNNVVFATDPLNGTTLATLMSYAET